MKKILEPVYLNEKMVLNTAAHLFEGYSLKEEKLEEKEKTGSAEISTGITLLSKLFSPISAKAEISGGTSKSVKSERLYTLGGLHMSVLKDLKKGSKPQLQPLNIQSNENSIRSPSFLSSNVILKPVDFYEIIQLLSLLRPLLVKLFDQFGDQMFENRQSLSLLNEVPKYDEMIGTLLKSLEDDYLKSRQLEMIMISPKTNQPIGVLDIPLDDYDPVEMKSKLNDGQFFIVGKLIRYIDDSSSLSLVQRTSFSQLVSLFEKVVSISGEADAIRNFKDGLSGIEELANKIIKLKLDGPVVRLLALSVSA